MIQIPDLAIIEFFSALISAGLIAAIVVMVIKTNWLGVKVERFRHIVLKTNLPTETAKREWVQIESHFFKGNENDLKVAIIEADKLLEDDLREAGVRGAHLGDRLKNLKPGQLSNVDQVWQAHRLRNDIAHQSNFKIKRDVAERALKIYEATLKELGLLS